MVNRKSHILLALLLLSCSAAVARPAAASSAASAADSLQVVFTFYYPAATTDIYTAQVYNAAEFERLHAFFAGHQTPDGDYPLTSITVTGYSSPTGRLVLNERFALERSVGFTDYLRRTFDLPASLPLRSYRVSEDWATLSRMVANSTINEREEILMIIEKNGNFNTRKELLRHLNGGRPYRILQREYFPVLSRVEVSVEVSVEVEVQTHSLTHAASSPPSEGAGGGIPSQEASQQHVATPHGEPGPGTLPEPGPGTSPAAWSIGMNLLSAFTLTPSTSLELFVNPNLSVNLTGSYAQWTFDGDRREIYGWHITPEIRRHFNLGSRMETSHRHVAGIYYTQGEFDVRLRGATGRMGHFRGGGVSLAYTSMLFPSQSSNIWWEVSVGLGYTRVTYDRYRYEPPCKVFERSRSRNLWGPGFLRLTIIYRFDGRKGGLR